MVRTLEYCYIKQPNKNISNYDPVTYFYQIELVDIKKYNTVYYYNFPTNDCNNVHAWDNYYVALTKIYPYNNNVKLGGKKINKQTRKKQTRKKQTRKKTK